MKLTRIMAAMIPMTIHPTISDYSEGLERKAPQNKVISKTQPSENTIRQTVLRSLKILTSAKFRKLAALTRQKRTN